MRLASLRTGGRDGTLVVVDRRLERGMPVPEAAATLQQALDDWQRVSPLLAEAGARLEAEPELVAHAARTRRLAAGTIIGSGTVSNRDPMRGCACLVERRLLETLEGGEPRTPFLRHGDRVRIEMRAPDGASIFGALDQEVRLVP